MASSPSPSVRSTASSRAEVVDRYRRLRSKRLTSPAAQTIFSDENQPTPCSIRLGIVPNTPRSSTANPLSPRNIQAHNSTLKDPPSRIRRDALSSEPSPLAAPSPSNNSTCSVSASVSSRRERRARHAKLLGNRGGRLTPSSLTKTPKSVMETPGTTRTPASTTSKYSIASKTPASVSKYYSYEPQSTKTKPPKTPTAASTKKNISSSSKSVCSMDPNEVSRRIRERRARGAKKLFIMATTPGDGTTESHGNTNLTPLERHFQSQEPADDVAVVEDSPSVASDISTLTMSTALSSLARDKRKFSRERKFSASRLYARATSSTTSAENKKEPTFHAGRGRSPIRRSYSQSSPPQDRGTPVRSNSTVYPTSSKSTTSGSETMTSIGRRAVSMQKARRLARSRSADRRTSTSTRYESPAQTASADRRTSTRYESPAQTPSASQSVSTTPLSVESITSVASSRAGSRAASIQKARRTLARTKSLGKMKVETTPYSNEKIMPPVFVAREKVEAQARLLSLAPQTRRNLDKRTARLKYHDEFALEVIRCQQEIGNPPPKHMEGENLLRRGKHGVSIFIRKRPIFDYELDAGDFDVVFTEGRDGCDAVVIHSCNMHADMRKMVVKPFAFPCSAAFDESCTNDMLYTHVGKPLVRLAAYGGMATLLMYGQTGSGKTFTVSGMEECVCKDLFRMITKSMQVKIQFVELAGRQCKDLLGGGDVRLVDQEDGSVLLLNSVSESVSSSEELYNCISYGKRMRATESTDKNDTSSRSHAVIQITVTNAKNQKRGVLTLIDCAGSERRNDSMYHSSDRQKESTEINSSLWALKECIRARASGGNGGPIPYRSSNLTRLLRESLEREDAQLCVIATLAPNATDTEHSLETLKTVSKLVAKDSTMEELKAREVTVNAADSLRPLSPKQWDRNRLVEWLGNKHFLDTDVPDHMDGKTVMRMNRIQLNNAFFGGNNGKKADRLFNALREETDRVNRAEHERRMAISTRGMTRETYEF